MKTQLLWFSWLILLLSGNCIYAQTINKDYIDGEIYIKLKELPTINLNSTNGTVNTATELPFLQNANHISSISSTKRSFYFSNSIDLQRIYRVKISKSSLIEKYIEEIKRDPSIEYVERVPHHKIISIPNDTGIGNQYHLTTIKAFEAWDISHGGVNIVVAVIDNAIQLNHPDLAGNMLPGIDISDNDTNPNPPDVNFSHGTHVAGIIGAVTNNGIGLSSVGYNRIKILPVKVTPNSGSAEDIYHGFEGISWAAENGANIINVSWGGGGFSATEQTVINDVYSRGILVVAAAGNVSSDAPMYPAAYEHVISVASTGNNDEKSYFSNYGSTIDLSAPGTNIYSTIPFDNYSYLSGTSMAAPLAASAFAYLWSVKPNLSLLALENLLKSTCDNIDTQNPTYIGQLGSGRINLLKAVSCSEGNILPIITHATNTVICHHDSTELVCNTIDGASYQWKRNGVNVGANKKLYMAKETGIYTVVVSKGSCSIAASSVNISYLPDSINISASSLITCESDSIMLTAPFFEGVSYQWKKDGTSIGTHSRKFYAKGSGNYMMILSGGNCEIASSPITLSFVSLNPTITSSGSPTICTGKSITLMTDAIANATYQWKKDGVLLNAATNSHFTTNQAGLYSLIIKIGQCSIISNSIKVSHTPYQAPTPSVTNRQICEGRTLVAGNGLQVSANVCKGTLTNIYTYTGNKIGYDGGVKSGVDPSITITDLDTLLISKVRVTIIFEKKDQTDAFSCDTLAGEGFPFNDELSFKIRSPTGIIKTLISTGTYDSFTYGGLVSINFEDDNPAIDNGMYPMSGTFAPYQALSAFNGQSANGTWTLLPDDLSAGDPLCVSGFSVEITVGNVSLPNSFTWWSAQTGGTLLGSGNEFLPTPTNVGIYTYYAQGQCTGACESERAAATFTITPSSIAPPAIIAYPISTVLATEIMPLLKDGVVTIQNTTSIHNDGKTAVISDKAPVIDPITICNGQNVLFLGTGCTGKLHWSTNDIATGIIVKPVLPTNYSVKCKEQSSGCLSPASVIRKVTIQPDEASITTAIPVKGNQTFLGKRISANQTIHSPSTTIIKASNSVVLLPGFTTTNNSVFSASIQNGCAN